MTSVMIALLLTVWALSVQGSAGDMSFTVADFLTIYGAYFDNLAQYQAGNQSHDYIQYWSVPVTTPAVPGKTVLYVEWAVNGVVLVNELWDPFEVNGVIRLDLYNFTDTTQYKPGAYKLENLAKLKPEDVQRSSTCQAVYEHVGRTKLVGSWPSCGNLVNGEPALYTDIATCDSIKVVIPPSAPEKSSTVPYNFVRKGDRYPVPGTPAGYVSPCS